MNPIEMYEYEIETSDGKTHRKTNQFNPSEVIRISYIPNTAILPRHDLIFLNSEFRYVKRFARCMMTDSNFIKEYLHCVVTDKFRFYLYSNGRTLITEKDYELYI